MFFGNIMLMSIIKVAQIAKVSSATVSRVINGRGPVRPETVKRVRRAMVKAGYVPKPLASRPGPRVGNQNYEGIKTGTVAMVMCMTPSFLSLSPVLSSVVQGAEEALTQRGLEMLQVYVHSENPVPPILCENQIDGALVIGTVPDSLDATLSRQACVTLMSEPTSLYDHVLCDNEAIGKLALEYLEKRGHRHVAFITLNKDHAASIPRCQSFCRAAKQSLMHVDVLECVNQWGNDLLNRPQAMEAMCETIIEQMQEMTEPPTGLFICFDAHTAALYPALKRHGIMPGKEVDVISCNHEEILLGGLSPRPAAIDIQSEYIGRRAVKQLCWRMGNLNDPTIIDVKIKPKLLMKG